MNGWHDLMRGAYRDVDALKEAIGLDEGELGDLRCVQETYPMLVNPYYLSLVDADDPDDPVRKLCVPSVEELDAAGQEDTSGEAANTVCPGVQHKYAETALLLSSPECAMYCRHCFRRRFVGVSGEETVHDVLAAADYIRAHPSITSVLVSGGDAFMMSDGQIRDYLVELCDIEHVRSIRFGTRTPVVLPQRIDAGLLQVLDKFSHRKQIYVVTHFDHPHEVTPEAAHAVESLMRVGVGVRNQTVLLRGVNDSAEVLAELMRDVASIGAIPYYVFQCRPVVGVKNRFQVPLREALRIVEGAKRDLDGMSKCFRFIMSHPTGKIEVVGEDPDDGRMLFKYHQAHAREDIGRVFKVDVAGDQCWLDGAQPGLRG